MRAREIFESTSADLPAGSRDTLPASMMVPDLDPYYEFYRFVIALAGFPNNDIPLDSIVRDQPMIVPYSKQEYEWVTKLLIKMGKHPKSLTHNPSTEMANVHKVSPVREFKNL